MLMEVSRSVTDAEGLHDVVESVTGERPEDDTDDAPEA